MTYFEWLCDKIWSPFIDICDYSKLLSYLFDRDFKWHISMDANRASDGIGLRNEYEYEGFYDRFLLQDAPCSVLEMMVGLALRVERDIMFDPDFGDRTHIWFWSMVENMGLFGAKNDHFSVDFLDEMMSKIESGDGDFDYFLSEKLNGDEAKSTRQNKTTRQKGVEIWKKMTAWLNEKYDF